MFLGSWKIDDYLVISANTSRFSSGVAYDASAITYRIYEDATNTEIVSDQNMTKFDSETGFYLDRVQLTAAAGFEVGKCYTVLIKATVDSVAGSVTHTFQVAAAIATAADNATAVWGAATKTVTSCSGAVASVTAGVTVSDKTGFSLATAPPSASDIATAVWGSATRTLTSFGTLVADIWGSTATNYRKLLAFCCGNASRADGTGTKTYTYKDTDNATTVMTHTYNGTDRTNT